MDPFLSVVASAFPGRDRKGRQSPNRPAGGTRRGPGNHRGRKSVFPSYNTHRRPSSAFFVFDEKKKIDLRKRFPSPAASPSLRRAFPLMVGGSIPLSELGGHSFQPYSNKFKQRGGGFEHRIG